MFSLRGRGLSSLEGTGGLSAYGGGIVFAFSHLLRKLENMLRLFESSLATRAGASLRDNVSGERTFVVRRLGRY